MIDFLFWFGAAWILYVYGGYPVVLWALSHIKPFRPNRDSRHCPSVSVLIAARNEARDIEWKVRETLAWRYPPERLEVLVASDASTDATDDLLAGIRDSRLRVVRLEQRSGKQVALNRLAELASGELLFFTDANTHIESTALRRAVAYFADERVGCVTGAEQQSSALSSSGIEYSSATYLTYESWLQELESRLGSVVACDGSIFLMRRSLFTPLDPEIANDLESPIRIAATGHAVLYDATLRSRESATTLPREEFRRRVRICGQGALAMWRLRHCLTGFRAFQFVSHKFLRWLALLPAAMVVFGSVWNADSPQFVLLICFEAALLVCALAAMLLMNRGVRVPAVFAMPFHFLLVNVAALTGILQTLLGRRFGVWEQPASSRGDSNGARFVAAG